MRAHYLAALAYSLTLAAAAGAQGAPAWIEGTHYFLVEPARPTSVPPGKVEVTEAFSYGCPACNAFLPVMRKLSQSLPPNAVLDYLPVSFNPSEDWPMFQQAFCTAQVLGIAEKTHDAMFDAVWKTGELSIDPAAQRMKGHLPTIEDAARFYKAHAGVAVEKFLSTAKSFVVDAKDRTDDDLVLAYHVDRTPTIIVNGKYRLHAESAGGTDQLIELVKWLVAKESGKEGQAGKASSRVAVRAVTFND
jgi:thiol:disulfide interchange protein DsbA